LPGYLHRSKLLVALSAFQQRFSDIEQCEFSDSALRLLAHWQLDSVVPGLVTAQEETDCLSSKTSQTRFTARI